MRRVVAALGVVLVVASVSPASADAPAEVVALRLVEELAAVMDANMKSCDKMGTALENGVVDHLGRVFGYRNLVVADGAIIPTPTVRNPSHTIAALAERIAAHVS